MSTVQEFLEVLFSPDPGGSFIEVRLIGSGTAPRIAFYESIKKLLGAIPQSIEKQNGFNVYFGVCPRSKREGSKASIKRVRCLWADLDGKDFGGGKAEALERLRTFELPPTAIVDSGHGYHCYWCLREAENISNKADVVRVESHLKSLAVALGGDPHAAELARILRLPGTFNLKTPDEPLPVTVLEIESGRQYNLRDFDLFSTDGESLPKPAGNSPGWIAKTLSEIREGNRNASFAKIAGRLCRDGLSPADITAVLKPHARTAGFPEGELEKEVAGICNRYTKKTENPKGSQANEPASEGKGSKATRLLKLIGNGRLDLFHDQFDEPHALLRSAPREVLKIQSKAFRRWLAHVAWQEMGQAVAGETLQTAIQALEGKALFEGRRIELQVRVAMHEGLVYYDLGDGRAAKITTEGWKVVRQFPILFRRLPHQKKQVEPVRGGDLKDFLSLVNLGDEGGERGQALLLLAWLAVALIPGFPHPLLVAHGPQGAAKSSMFKMIKELLDPSEIRTLSPADCLRELVLHAHNHWFLPLDNLSTLPDWMSDSLSRACTGDGFSKRELFTDTDEVILVFQRIIGLNGINLVVDKPDLLDRSILLPLERIQEKKRIGEAELWGRFNEIKPRLMGALFDAVSEALRIYPEVELSDLPRMADFTEWGAAVAIALGYSSERFLAAYHLAIDAQHKEAISASLVAQAVVCLMDDRNEWQGKPSELLGALNETAESLKIDIRGRGWPKDPNWVWRRLREAQANLEAIGIEIERSTDGKRHITIRKCAKNAVDAADAAANTPSLVQHLQHNPPEIGSETGEAGNVQLNLT